MARKQRKRLTDSELLDLQSLMIERIGDAMAGVHQLVEDPQQRTGMLCEVIACVFTAVVRVAQQDYQKDTGRKVSTKNMSALVAYQCVQEAIRAIDKI